MVLREEPIFTGYKRRLYNSHPPALERTFSYLLIHEMFDLIISSCDLEDPFKR